MKLIIDITDEEYQDIKDNPSKWGRYVQTMVGNGTPYEERPQGEWIAHSSENLLWGHNECPLCHKRSNRDASYCQYCGADMRGEKK